MNLYLDTFLYGKIICFYVCLTCGKLLLNVLLNRGYKDLFIVV